MPGPEERQVVRACASFNEKVKKGGGGGKGEGQSTAKAHPWKTCYFVYPFAMISLNRFGEKGEGGESYEGGKHWSVEHIAFV